MLPKTACFNMIRRSFNSPLIYTTVSYSKDSASIPKNVLENVQKSQNQQDHGSVYDKKPFKMALEAGKKYSWCLCGKSKNQPLCDGTHKIVQLKIKQKPVRFAVDESKEYWICNCKHTNNRPFCDGTHKAQLVQDQSSTIRQ